MNLRAIIKNLICLIFEHNQMLFFINALEGSEVSVPQPLLDNFCMREIETFADLSRLSIPKQLRRKEAKRRFKKGDRCFLAYVNGECAHYSWVAFYRINVAEIRKKIYFGRGAFIIYDCFTDSKFRGKNIYPYVLTYIKTHLKKRGYGPAYIYTKTTNEPSQRGIKKAGFRVGGNIRYWKLLGFTKHYCQGESSFLESMRKKKLAFVIDDLGRGGAGRQFCELLKGLSYAGTFELFLYYFAEVPISFKDEIPRNIQVTYVPQKGRYDIKAFLRLYSAFKKERFHSVHTFLFTADVYGRLAAAMAGVPLIISSQRNIDIWKKMRHIIIDRLLAQGTKVFIVNAEAEKAFLIGRERIDASKMRVIYNGIDMKRFSEQASSATVREIRGSGTDKNGILTIARFSPQKDYDTLIEAAKYIVRQRKDVFFILIGKGPLRDKVFDKIIQQGLEDYFTVLDQRKKIEEFYHASTLGILTSLYEGCSNFILESMASGLPVIATSVGGNPELIIDSKTGYLVPPKNPEKIAEKALFLLDHPDIALQLGKDARKRVEENFTIEKMIQAHLQLYQEILS